MTEPSTTDGASRSTVDAAAWERIERKCLAGRIGDRRARVVNAVYEAEEALQDGDCLIAEQMSELCGVAENDLVAVADAEAWEHPPQMPAGVIWEMTNHPNADGVAPREYVDDTGEGTDE